MAFELPLGFRTAGAHCGVKADPAKHDLALLVSDYDCTAAGVYTKNRIFAAPVALDRTRTPGDRLRGVIVNSGNANACTGDRGLEDAKRMAALAAAAVGVAPEQFLVMSTGVIGRFLPMDKIEGGVGRVAAQLGNTSESVLSTAQAFMTTDTKPKIAVRSCDLSGRTVRLLGVCKGAAMIAPNMGTMLATVMTDAPLAKSSAQMILSESVDESFNCVTIDGHMSTNDTVLLLANGQAGGEPIEGPDLGHLRSQLGSLCMELAKAIADDGEGATHVIILDVEGCATVAAARTIASSIANSALVKCAFTGADPNWGRIVSAAGYAGVEFNPAGVSLHIQGHHLYEAGAPVAFDKPVVSAAMRDSREVHVVLRFQEGTAKARMWTTDLTAEYVHLNADYTT